MVREGKKILDEDKILENMENYKVIMKKSN